MSGEPETPKEAEPVEEGGDPACWAHLFADQAEDADADEGDAEEPDGEPPCIRTGGRAM